MSKKVSILMLTYNGEKYLKEAIDSCLNQTHENIEVCIIDDGSTDGTIEILKSYGDKIKVTYNEINQGIVANVNKLGLHVESDYIVLIGHDDKLSPNHVELMLSEFEEDTVLVFCNAIIIDGSGKEVRIMKDDNEMIEKLQNPMFEFSLNNFLNAIGQMIRTDTFQKVKGWNTDYKNYGDWFFYIKILQLGNIKYTTKTKSYYRVHETNISNKLRTKEVRGSVEKWAKNARKLAHKTHNNSLGENIKYYYNYIKIDFKKFIKKILGI